MSRLATSLKNLLSFRSPLSAEKEKPEEEEDQQPRGSPGNNGNDRDNQRQQQLRSNSVDDILDEDFVGDETQLPYPVHHYQESESPKIGNRIDQDGVGVVGVNRALLFEHHEGAAQHDHEAEATPTRLTRSPAKSRATSFPDLPTVDEGNLSFQQGGGEVEPQPLARPVLDEINGDVADWICHVCLSQGDPTLVQDDARALATLLRTSNVSLTPQQALRMAITSFYVNLCGVVANNAGGGDDDIANDEDEFAAVRLESGEWAALDEQFAALSRKMAHFAEVRGKAIDAQALEIGRLVKVQRALAFLTRDLDQILKERPSSVRSEAEVVLNSHLQRLEIVYTEPWSGPDELVVCSPDQAPGSSSGVAQVVHKVKQIVSGGEFSQGVLERKVQTYLIDWVSRNLETPTLVKFRYRGVVPFKTAQVPLASSEDDIIAGDMSSLGDGVDTDEELMRLEDIDGERGERQPRQHRRQRLRSTDTESKASEPRRKRGEQNGGPAPAGQGRQGIGKVARRPAPGVKAPRQFHFPNKPSLHQPSPPNCASSHSNSETGDQLPREDRANAAPVSRKARGLDFSDDDEDEDRPESQVANGAPVSRKARGLDFSDDDEDEDRPETQVPMAQVDRRDNGDDDNSGDTTESDETVDPDADRQPKKSRAQETESAKDAPVQQPKGNSAAAIRPRKRRLEIDDSSEEDENRHPASPYQRLPRKNPRVRAALRPSIERREKERDSQRSDLRQVARGSASRNSLTPQRGPSDRLSFSSSSSSSDGRRRPGNARPSQVHAARNGNSQPAVSGRTKNLFTDAEVQAIREGVARFGVGEWQKIKVHSNGRLLARSAVQIKDKYRNMVRTGQI